MEGEARLVAARAASHCQSRARIGVERGAAAARPRAAAAPPRASHTALLQLPATCDRSHKHSCMTTHPPARRCRRRALGRPGGRGEDERERNVAGAGDVLRLYRVSH